MKTLMLTLSVLLTACGGGDAALVVPTSVALQPESKTVELVAHRGIGGKDNTIASFTVALNLGFTSLETDLRMQHGKVVLAHDRTLSRVKYESLEDFLIFASNSGASIWIEAKETETIKPTIELLKNHNLNVVFMSYRQSDVDLIMVLNPEIKTGLVITKENQIETANADWVAIHHSFVAGHYDRIKHMKVAAWTFQEQKEYNGIKHLIDAAISDVQLTQ